MESGLPTTPEQLQAKLDELGIATRTYEHPPVFTVEEAGRLRGELPGGHCKSLFLKDKKGALWLVVALEDRKVELKALAGRVGAARLSFGRPELLWEVLGVSPGAVTPFALINDEEHRVKVVLDAEMMSLPLLNYHPLVNTATTALSPEDLKKFLAACGHEPIYLRF